MVQYGGDEVSALVLDIGTSTLRAGYAGDDAPKAIIPTSYGYITQPASSNPDVTMDDATAENGEQPPKDAAPAEETRLFIGQHGPSIWRANMEIGNPMKDGLINDFKPIPALIRHAFEDVMRVNLEEHPVLVTEPAWNTVANRERMAEIMFEEFNVPAFYIANTSVLNAFASGKGSALVVDIGQSQASVTPVVDGFVLRKGLHWSTLPQLIHARSRQHLTNAAQYHPPIELLPYQLIASKEPVEPNAPPRYVARDDRIPHTTDSLRLYYETREVDEWIQSVAGVVEQGWNEHQAAAYPPKQYEFPTGFNTYFGVERFAVGELFFNHGRELETNPTIPRPIPSLIAQALSACDPDMRGVLTGNVVLSGGGSSFSGFADRLNVELSRHYPHVKIHAPGNTAERRYGGWLGGSILASLGTFHQLWISKEEWQEHGKAIVGQRCK
ncbi:brg1-associated factor b [Stereum hirsutum FP-91666 SS1]|uniref:brg1-associated factor b n=1 Tax=Stereum hirsutum (strain FP-91666) TaxID=721885 RepID=UPI000440FDD9|nr:brg1-associated factor b [Stereum hirsutum FP-91666 SS1]EIM88243.1 brg1-associated factor b [Stereum hirsutum FP-91666 SS1]